MSVVRSIYAGVRALGIAEEEDRRHIYERVTGKRSLRAMTPSEKDAVLDEEGHFEGVEEKQHEKRADYAAGAPAPHQSGAKRMSVDIVITAVGGPLGLRLASNSAGDGVSVLKARPGSVACTAGLHTNDVLLSISGVTCTDPIETERQLHDAMGQVVLKVRLPRPNPLDVLNNRGSAEAGSSAERG